MAWKATFTPLSLEGYTEIARFDERPTINENGDTIRVSGKLDEPTMIVPCRAGTMLVAPEEESSDG